MIRVGGYHPYGAFITSYIEFGAGRNGRSIHQVESRLLVRVDAEPCPGMTTTYACKRIGPGPGLPENHVSREWISCRSYSGSRSSMSSSTSVASGVL